MGANEAALIATLAFAISLSLVINRYILKRLRFKDLNLSTILVAWVIVLVVYVALIKIFFEVALWRLSL